MKQRTKRKQVKLIESDAEFKIYDYRRKVINKTLTRYNAMQDDMIHTWCDLFLAGWCQIFAELLSKKFKLPIEGIFEQRLITSKDDVSSYDTGLVHAYVAIPNTDLVMDVLGVSKNKEVFCFYNYSEIKEENEDDMWIDYNAKKVIDDILNKRKWVNASNYQIYKNETNWWKKRAKKMIREVYGSHFRKEMLSIIRNPNHEPSGWYDHWMENKPA